MINFMNQQATSLRHCGADAIARLPRGMSRD